MQWKKCHCTQELFGNSFTSKTPNPQFLLPPPAAAFHPLGLLLQHQTGRIWAQPEPEHDYVRSNLVGGVWRGTHLSSLSAGLLRGTCCNTTITMCQAAVRLLVRGFQMAGKG